MNSLPSIEPPRNRKLGSWEWPAPVHQAAPTSCRRRLHMQAAKHRFRQPTARCGACTWRLGDAPHRHVPQDALLFQDALRHRGAPGHEQQGKVKGVAGAGGAAAAGQEGMGGGGVGRGWGGGGGGWWRGCKRWLAFSWGHVGGAVSARGCPPLVDLESSRHSRGAPQRYGTRVCAGAGRACRPRRHRDGQEAVRVTVRAPGGAAGLAWR